MARPPTKLDVKGETGFCRPAYEGISAIVWGACALVYVAIGRLVHEGIGVVAFAAIPMMVLSAYNAHKVWKNWMFKTRLTNPLPAWIKPDQLFDKQRRSGKTFIGKGFEWEPAHARMMKEIASLSTKYQLTPPAIFRRAMTHLGLTSDVLLEGRHYIHGCGGYEEDLFVTDQSRRSHTLVLGTNGAGKTRALEAMVAQSIRRGELTEAGKKKLAREEDKRLPGEDCPNNGLDLIEKRIKPFRAKFGPVFILDPKGDVDLRDRAYATAKQLGREEHFHYFSPTHDSVSFRINPLANFNRTTELANRVAALLPTGGESEAFRQFAWRAINVVVQGLTFTKAPVTLKTLREHIEGGIEELAISSIQHHLDTLGKYYPNWRDEVLTIAGRQRSRRGSDNPAATSSDLASLNRAKMASALASYYLNKVKVPNPTKNKPPHPNATIDGIVDVIEHDAQHYNKLIGNLLPILNQLTSEPMGVLLSDPEEEAEARPQRSFQGLIDFEAIVYINFESLADSVVGSALGSLFLADLTACAARRHHNGKTDPPVAVFVDEAAEMMNDPFIQALNKGRAAGFELTLASQTIADFVARMGNEAKAMQVLGNVNTTIAMRLQDNESIQMVSDKFASTNYEERVTSKSSTTIAAVAQRGRDYSGSISKNTQTSDLPLVTADLLASLPPGHFFGHLPGGRKVKGRVLMMKIDDDDRFVPSKNGHVSFQHTLSTQDVKKNDATEAVEHLEKVILGGRLVAQLRRHYSSLRRETIRGQTASETA